MATPTPRANVRGILEYVPGRPPAPGAGPTTYKLSSNENPYPPLPGVLDAAIAAAERMNRYPDMDNTALYDALADRLGVPVDDLAVATGSVALIYNVIQAYCDLGDEVVYAWRSFESYPIAVAARGAVGVQVPLMDGARHDLAAMAAAITDRTKLVIVCTPNNPTGPALTRGELEEFVESVPEHVLIMIDEAYLEFVRMDQPVDGLAVDRHRADVVLVRTFSKAYGLAGLRVGYAVAPAPVAAVLRAVSLPFGVSGIAQAAAVSSLRQEVELLERVEAVVAERARVVTGLRDRGWQLPDAQGNFVWLALGERTAEFAAAADRAGVAVRPFAGEGCRFTIGEPEANDRVLALAATGWT
jgi:histidinol-phosphate aminotransferase